MSKSILVLGATGKQGGSVVRALLAHPDFSPSKYTILAATRNPASESAKRLATLSPAIKPVTGDLRDAQSMFRGLPSKPWGVYAVTSPGKTEEQDGIATVNAAVEAGTQHFVFGSVDRGVADNRNTPSQVPHFITKHNIEDRLRQAATASAGSFSYTVIRPPFFLDNLEPGFFGKVTATMWRDRVSRPMSVIDTRDIGTYAAAAFMEPQSPAYRNAELNIAGDRLTFQEADRIFVEKTGQHLPTTFSFMVSLVMWLSNDFNKMVQFFEAEGFAATPEESKLHHMTSFAEWIDASRHVKKQT